MTRKPTSAADQELADITRLAIRNAHHFTCTILSDRRYLTERARDLAGARAFGPQLEARAANHRKAIVYAVMPNGSTYMVPDDFK